MLDSESPIVARATVEAPRHARDAGAACRWWRAPRAAGAGARASSWTDVALCLLGCGALLLWLESIVGRLYARRRLHHLPLCREPGRGQWPGLQRRRARRSKATAISPGSCCWPGWPGWASTCPSGAANLGRVLSLLNLVLLYALSYGVVAPPGLGAARARAAGADRALCALGARRAGNDVVYHAAAAQRLAGCAGAVAPPLGLPPGRGGALRAGAHPPRRRDSAWALAGWSC